ARFTHEREQMRAGLRLGFGLLAAALALAPATALAQDARAATTNTPATDTIGPRELQNFSIDGTVTRPAEPQPAARSPARTRTASTPAQTNRTPAATSTRRVAQTAVQASAPPPPDRREAARQTTEPARSAAPSSSVTVALPRLQDDLPRGGGAATLPASAPGFAADPEPAAGTLAPDRKIDFL